jgi:beta-mannosidase
MHPFCVVERQEFYDLCDEIGLLVYQDFPLWMMVSNDSDLVRRALPQARSLLRQWGHHPSIAIWNFGSQPSVANFKKISAVLAEQARRLDPSRVVSQANAAFARDGDDTHPTRSFFWQEEAGVEMANAYDWRFDTHIYAGWYYGEASDVENVPKEHLELVTEFGAQALPRRTTLEQIIPAEDLYPPKWSSYAARCCQVDILRNRVSIGESLDEFIANTQRYQADVLRTHIEYYRRHKFTPCNGAHIFAFSDCWPAVTWSIIEYDRTPKAAYEVVRRAMAPLQVFLAPLEEEMTADTWRLRMTVVNDLLTPVVGELRVAASYFDDDEKCGSATASRPCQVDAMGSREFNGMELTLPLKGFDRAELQLTVVDSIEECSNEYVIHLPSEHT